MIAVKTSSITPGKMREKQSTLLINLCFSSDVKIGSSSKRIKAKKQYGKIHSAEVGDVEGLGLH